MITDTFPRADSEEGEVKTEELTMSNLNINYTGNYNPSYVFFFIFGEKYNFKNEIFSITRWYQKLYISVVMEKCISTHSVDLFFP